MSVNKMRAGTLAMVVVALLGLSGCSSASNKGGDTTCGDFVSMSDSEKTEVIKTFLESKGESDPANMQVSLNKASATLYCKTAGSDSSPIKNIDG